MFQILIKFDITKVTTLLNLSTNMAFTPDIARPLFSNSALRSTTRRSARFFLMLLSGVDAILKGTPWKVWYRVKKTSRVKLTTVVVAKHVERQQVGIFLSLSKNEQVLKLKSVNISFRPLRGIGWMMEIQEKVINSATLSTFLPVNEDLLQNLSDMKIHYH